MKSSDADESGPNGRKTAPTRTQVAKRIAVSAQLDTSLRGTVGISEAFCSTNFVGGPRLPFGAAGPAASTKFGLKSAPPMAASLAGERRLDPPASARQIKEFLAAI
jgi:hypothetical protein